MSRRTALAVLVTALPFGLAACGGGSKDAADAVPAGPLTRAQLATKADAICAAARTEAQGIPAPKSAKNTNTAAAYFAKLAPISHGEAESFGKLEADADAKFDWAMVVSGQQQIAGAFDAIVTKTQGGKRIGATDYAAALKASQPFLEATAKIGANGCAGVGTATTTPSTG